MTLLLWWHSFEDACFPVGGAARALRLLVGKIGCLAGVTYEIENELTRAGCSSRTWMRFVDPKILPVVLPDCVLKAPAVAAPLHGALL